MFIIKIRICNNSVIITPLCSHLEMYLGNDLPPLIKYDEFNTYYNLRCHPIRYCRYSPIPFFYSRKPVQM